MERRSTFVLSPKQLYLILAGVFIASLVSCNLIFQKFFSWAPFGIYTFELSVGILPYPITFLVTDLISEIYGKKRANFVVISGLGASVFVLGVILLADCVPATDWSPVNNVVFSQVFGLSGVAVFASMVAYLLAQLVDVRIFHFLKQKTKGKHLWLRNNLSTITSQLLDTATVLVLLCATGSIKWALFFGLFLNGFIFKVLVALFDTPILYFLTWLIRKQYNLQEGQEIMED